jgi:hypothetical protein
MVATSDTGHSKSKLLSESFKGPQLGTSLKSKTELKFPKTKPWNSPTLRLAYVSHVLRVAHGAMYMMHTIKYMNTYIILGNM